MKVKRLVLLLCLAAFLPGGPLQAQSARWRLSESKPALDSPFRAELIVENGIPRSDPELPVIPFLEASGPQRQSPSAQRSADGSAAVYVYTLRPLRPGPYTIPAFPLVTDRGVVSVPAVTFWAGEPSFSPSFASSAEASLALFRNEVWQGEPFPVEYRLLAQAGAFLEITGQPEWTPAELLVDRWSRPERVSGESRGIFFSGLRYSALAIAFHSGKLSLPPVSQHVSMEAGKFGQGLFSQAVIRPLILRSTALSLEVKALPPPPKDGFSQAVGTFRLTSQLSPSEVQVGEPATWMLRIEGMGNWTAPWTLPLPTIPPGLRVIEPAPRRQSDPDSLFCASLVMERILVAERPGRYTVPPYRFSYFDPLAGVYRTALAPSAVLTVSPGPSPVGSPPEGSSSDRALPSAAETPAKERVSKFPFFGSADGLVPVENRWLWVEAGGFAAALLVLWLILARRHARLSDPEERRRSGLRRLRRIHREIRRSLSPGERQQQLLRWQSAIRDAWLIPPAVPELAEVEAALEQARLDPADRATWLNLWREAEAHLYAREAGLPPDWIERCEAQTRRMRIPRLAWKKTFTRRHWFPLLMILGLLLTSSWGSSVPMFEGHGRKAHEDFRERILQSRPTDWIARANYGVVLARAGRWREALAQWSSAFLMAPRDSAVRTNFALALSHCPGADPRLSALAHGPLWVRWISIGSPAEWQILLSAALLVAFAGAVFWLLWRYRLLPLARSFHRFVLVCGLGLSAIAATAVALYGPMSNPQAGLLIEDGILHSVPTDAQPESRPVMAPALVVVGKPFLHWVRVSLSDRRAGWLRAESVVPFFRPALSRRDPSLSAAGGAEETIFPSASPL